MSRVSLGPVCDSPAVTATGGGLPGEADTNWQPAGESRVEVVSREPDSGISAFCHWTLDSGLSTLSRGTTYWFRIAAIGTVGRGPWRATTLA